jgi:hypothetical protein
MHDIHERREADMDTNNKSPEIGEITNDDNTTTNCVFSNESHPVMATQSVILCVRYYIRPSPKTVR